jgi:hypothetical protein
MSRRRLRADTSLLQARFAAGCDLGRCFGQCCRTGVWLDPRERGRVLAHAGLVRQAMDAGQALDPQRWFRAHSKRDRDFPSGRAVHTRVVGGRCVFLNDAGRCVLQKASLQARLRVSLKPYFCIAYPATIDGGLVKLDDEPSRAGRPCCGATPGGPLTALDVCGRELRFVLGAAGLRALRDGQQPGVQAHIPEPPPNRKGRKQ